MVFLRPDYETAVLGVASCNKRLKDRYDRCTSNLRTKDRRFIGVLFAAIAFGATACSHRATPQELADQMTRAVYAGDAAAVRSRFNDAVKPSVTPQSVSDVSARMHKYGEYRGLSEVAEIPKARRYDFEAEFATGTMLVQLKLDANGAIAAYRVVPNEAR